MIKFKKLKHTIFNFFCIITFLVIFIVIALLKGNSVGDVIGFKNIGITYLFVVSVYIVTGLIFDLISNFLNNKNSILKVLVEIVFYGTVLLFTTYILLIIVLLSLSKGF